jgi:hypothetical protein
MSYLTRVDELRRAELYKRAREFAASYDPNLPTIVLLPGGMGSRLLRSSRAYDPDSSPKVEEFYELWLGLGPVLQGELASLTFNQFTEEVDQHPIIAAGELSSMVKSYDGIFAFFAGKANVVGLGYDWRRAPDKECGYVRVFLEYIARQVKLRNPGWTDPRRHLTLYAHSQGGLVAKLFVNELLDSGENPADWFERLVTCCTPFYGTCSHFQRYYVGEELVNAFTGGADRVARIVASLEGPYILLPAPPAVLAPRLDALGLERYPVRDFDDPGIECDPYSGATALRYRPEVLRAHLVAAREQFELIDRSLPQKVARRVYHIRSDIFGGASGGKNLELGWKAVTGSTYTAAAGNPISDNSAQGGRGDGTVPFWAARLATTPPTNVFDISGVKHGGAAEHPLALDILWNLMRGAPVAPGPQQAAFDFEFSTPDRVAVIGAQLIASHNPQYDLDGLQAGEYRAFVDGLRLA